MDIQVFINNIADAHTTCNCQEMKAMIYEYSDYINLSDAEHIDSYWNTVSKISDIGLKYLLQGIILEIIDDEDCIEMYKTSIENNCTIALYKIAEIYNTDIFGIQNYCVALSYYYQYFKKTDNIGTFIDVYVNAKDTASYGHVIMEEIIKITARNEELLKKCTKYKSQINELNERITEMEYAPGGVGYHECKKHFEELSKKKQ